MYFLEDDLGDVFISKEDEPIVKNEDIHQINEAAKTVEGKTAHHCG